MSTHPHLSMKNVCPPPPTHPNHTSIFHNDLFSWNKQNIYCYMDLFLQMLRSKGSYYLVFLFFLNMSKHIFIIVCFYYVTYVFRVNLNCVFTWLSQLFWFLCSIKAQYLKTNWLHGTHRNNHFVNKHSTI